MTREEVFVRMDEVRSILERLPEEACGHLGDIRLDWIQPEIQFCCDTFAAAVSAFPFVRPDQIDYTEDYVAEGFRVDGVWLYHLIAKDEGQEAAHDGA